MSFDSNVTQGRGAWTRKGKDNGSTAYEYLKGKPLDGQATTDGKPDPAKAKDDNYRAVNLAVLALQKEAGLTAKADLDGIFGNATRTAVIALQNKLKLVADGQAGAATWRAILRSKVEAKAKEYGVPPELLWGLAKQESAFDPGAVGYVSPKDHGLMQINLGVHPVTIEQAHDVDFALSWGAEELAQARAKFDEKGPTALLRCGVLNHNSPANARKLYANGVYPTDQARDYVEKVLRYASEWVAAT